MPDNKKAYYLAHCRKHHSPVFLKYTNNKEGDCYCWLRNVEEMLNEKDRLEVMYETKDAAELDLVGPDREVLYLDIYDIKRLIIKQHLTT